MYMLSTDGEAGTWALISNRLIAVSYACDSALCISPMGFSSLCSLDMYTESDADYLMIRCRYLMQVYKVAGPGQCAS